MMTVVGTPTKVPPLPFLLAPMQTGEYPISNKE